MKNVRDMYPENEGLFLDFEVDMQDVPKYINYVMYRAISCYYVDKYDEAARWINNLLNEVSLKKYALAQLEIKIVLALQYCLMSDYDLFNQLINSIQRQIRLTGKDSCEHILLFSKMLKISISDIKKNKYEKIEALVDKFVRIDANQFSPTKLIKMDEAFIGKLSKGY